MLRYSPAIDRLKHWISEGYIGRPIMATSENIMEVRPKLVMHAKNINGGPVIDFWCHHFDLWSYLFESEPESLGGYGAIFGADKLAGENLGELAIDTAAVNIKYRSGDIAQFSTSWGLPIVFKTHHLDRDCFIGPKGYIIGDIRGTLTLITEDGKTDTVSNTGLDWWGHEVNVLADILRGSEQPYIGIDEGIAALKVSLAALEAIEKSQTIRL
jgi:predicted dehydrogenase